MASLNGSSDGTRGTSVPDRKGNGGAPTGDAALQRSMNDPAKSSREGMAHVAAPAPDRSAEAAQQARRLIASANELLTLAAELEEVARRGSAANGNAASASARVAPPLPEGGTLLEDDVRWLRHARRTYRNRRSRANVFGDESLFGEPAWDLMLDLFIAAKERKRVPVTSACIGAAVPTTTALRWLAVLEERGLVVREADASDARRVFVRLSAEAYGKMVAFFVRAAVGDAEDTIEAARAHGRAIERAWR